MDRVRFVSLPLASQDAFADHPAIMATLKARDEAAAMASIRRHLSRIHDQIIRIRADHERLFPKET